MSTFVEEIDTSNHEKSLHFVETSKAVFPSQTGPVTIIEPIEEDHTFVLNVEFLERILLNPKYADKKVII